MIRAPEMYSFFPLENINTVDVHTGFYMIAAAMAASWIWMMLSCRDDLEGAGWTTAVMLVLVGIAGLISWNSGEIKTYTNTEVRGEFVEFVAEGFNIPEYAGKTTRHVDKHLTYVVYKVDNELVMLPAATGVTFPKFAVLYKN
jgi:hypothetical protein